MATLSTILSVNDRQEREIVVPEWGNLAIRVRCMSALDRANIERDFTAKKASADPGGFRVAVLAACLRDDLGEPLGTREEMAAILTKSAVVVERLFEMSCELSGLIPAAVEGIEKN